MNESRPKVILDGFSIVINSYADALLYLYQALPMFQRVGAVAYKKDLTNTLQLCEVLGNPQIKFKSIHVAGTNGKGSTSHMLASILQRAGYKTGLYTSPHLKEFTERIKINGVEVTQRFVLDFVNRMEPSIARIQPSFFELTVAMAFEYFAQSQVDVAVIEVGLGGRLDSTNVITPELSLITNISFDHKDLLGDTLPKIAFEKAGIIKKNVPVIISKRQKDVESVFIEKATNMNSNILFATDKIQLKNSDNGFDVFYNGQRWLSNLQPELKGNYQRRNLPGVLAAVLALRERGFTISDESIVKGIGSASTITGLKGRWQKLRDRPLMICDTGHNEDGIREVMEQIKQTPHKRLYIVFGVVKEKDLQPVLSLLPTDASYFFCQAKIPRALDASSLHHAASSFGLNGRVIPSVNDAIEAALREANEEDLIFIGGSTFVVAEIENL